MTGVDTMSAYQVILSRQFETMRQLESQIAAMQAIYSIELRQLEKACVEQHGYHLDDGGFFRGSCVRCGYNFG